MCACRIRVRRPIFQPTFSLPVIQIGAMRPDNCGGSTQMETSISSRRTWEQPMTCAATAREICMSLGMAKARSPSSPLPANYRRRFPCRERIRRTSLLVAPRVEPLLSRWVIGVVSKPSVPGTPAAAGSCFIQTCMMIDSLNSQDRRQ